mmetsp:Transcript_9033/g.18068  ORF Transcript_9033/g.18068 Transcript_9033/m.18068 type:complete len:806 (-) Transcript_9033:85-2502(-)
MNILTILLLSASAAISHANGNTLNLRGGDIQNNFFPEERELSDTCVSRSAYLGCYENRNQNRALPHEIGGRPHTARECEEACANKGFLYFAREWRGQCFCSNTDDYNKHGTATNCDCCGTNVGANKMCVYKLQTAEAPYPAAPGCTDRFNAAPYMGCYVDRNRRRALPHEVHGRGYSAEDCHVECNKAGYKYFARQWRGQCFCGNHDYDKYGPASNCNCCGRSVGANKMCVWEGDGAGTPPTEAATTTTTTTTSPPDTYEVQSNELRTSASYKRAMAKTHHDNGNLKDASIAFREAAMLLDEAMEALSQSSSINDNDAKEEEEGNIAVERATCRLHEALCLLKDGRPGDCVEACTDVLEDDVTVVPLDNESENGDDDGADPTQQAAVVKIIPATTTTGASNKPAIPAQIRARAHHRRAKARLALGDLDGALEDARSAAFMGDRNAVQFYGRLMREGSATTTGAELSSSPSSPMGMGGGSNPFLDGMLGGMGGNTNPFMPSPGAGSSSDFSSSLLSSLLTGSSGSGSGGGGNPFGLMGELLSPPEESTGSSKRRRGKAKKDSLAKSVLKNIMKRIEDEETQETICGYLQSTNKQQIMQFSTMAGVPIKEETAQRLSGLANGITPKGIRKGVRRVKRGLKVVKTGRKILKVIDKYKPVIIVAVLLYWVRSAILEPYPISKKKKLEQAALGLLIMPTHKSALTNVRGALSKVFMSPAEADAGIVEDDSSSSGIEEELEKLQHQLTLIEAIEERNKAQIYSFIDEEDQWNSMEKWEQELLSSKEALTQRMEQMTEELVLMFMGEKAKNG